MEPEASAASWHPALMPNSRADDKHDHDPEHDTHDETISQSGSHNGAILEQSNPKESPEAAGAWDDSHESPQTAPVTSDATTQATTQAPAPMEFPQHASRMSFARTVSHEVDFIDDDDSDWSLQRTDTDPFRFMPPNERTNSFPVVPTRDASQDEPASRPPAPSQAQEIIQDLEDEDHDDSTIQAGAPTTPGVDATSHLESKSSFQPAIGGEISGTDATGERFEEGLPLIAQDEEESEEEDDDGNNDNDQSEAQPKKLGDFGDPFAADDKGEADDFFSQVKDTDDQFTSPRTLKRKSTTMAIGGVIGPGEEDDHVSSPSEEGPAQGLTETTDDGEHKAEGEQPVDLDAKWAAAFGDDDEDEFLAEPAETKELDPADIFGSDDEGFLDDDDNDATAGAPTAPQVDSAPSSFSAPNGRYMPAAGAQPQQRPANPYAPGSIAQQPSAQQAPAYSNFTRGASNPVVSMFAPTPPRPEIAKAQSFADKAKGGYQSPYDLPMDVVKSPKKRSSMQQLPRPSTIQSQAPPTGLPRAASGPAHQLGGVHKPPALRPSNSGFFEDLPMASPKSRPASRTSYRPPGQVSPLGPPQGPPLPSPLGPSASEPGPQQMSGQRQPSGTPGLVAPEQISPYAAMSSSHESKPAAPAAASNRYSPAPPNGLGVANGGAVPPLAISRYSPAPPVPRASNGGYGAVASGIPPPILVAHQPRTSSPLAQYEVTRDLGRNRLPSPAHSDAGGAPLARTNSNQYELRANRIPSLPATQEVEEEIAASQAPPVPTNVSPQLRYSNEARRTPPPMGLQPSMLSPPKRATNNYSPHTAASPGKESNFGFVPPPRSQAGSPGPARYAQGSLSGHSVTSPPFVQSPPTMRPSVRVRGLSQHLNLVAPTDGRENDPLQRWRGSPVFSWGVGGTFVTSFPKNVPRYGIQSAVPQITRCPGEVKVQHVKDIHPLDEQLSKFPGPLKGRSKKKDTIGWLATAIESLEQQQPHVGFQISNSHQDKRLEERILLYKILKTFIENDGVLEGNANVDKAVREVISPETSAAESSQLSIGADLGTLSTPMTTMQTDSVDYSAIEQIRKFLLAGEREKAAWLAVDRRLWGHALLLANTVQTADLYKKVAQEFIKKEVNHPGHNNESLAALYGVLSGNYEESVDELVPSHARAGMQLISTSSAGPDHQDALAGLDKWRETLGLILSNRSLADVQALGSLGNLLSSYGRAEAAHICYLFARQHVTFGGLDDPNAQFVLVGADHKRQAEQFSKQTEALLLSEVFEYGLSLAGGAAATQGCPHLAAYKLQHALILAQYGFRDKALQYCESIYNAISSQTKRSPYYNAGLETAVDDLLKRLKQAPKEESSSWITKPTSSGMWNRFNKFVAGDDNEAAGDGAVGDLGTESGPFARISGGTPTISRSPSMNNFELYGSSPGASAAPVMSLPPTKASSRYAPGGAQTVTSPYEPTAGPTGASRTSGELPRSPYEPSGQSVDGPYTNGNPYTPQTPNSTHQPASAYGGQESPYTPAQPTGSEAPTANPYGGYGGYEPYGAPTTEAKPDGQPVALQGQEHATEGTNSTYEAPSYGYQPPALSSYDPPTLNTFDSAEGGNDEPPPSYQPSSFEAPSYEPGPGAKDDEDDEQSMRKKKSFMDDDDDDYPSVKPKEKSKAEKDKENEELVRRVAEQEAKQEAEGKGGKKGWGFGGWFGGAKKDLGGAETPKAIKAKLGEQSSFVYDPELKRWVNKKAGAEDTVAKSATPPPPRGTPPPPAGASAMAPPPSMSAPPTGPPRNTSTPSPAFGRSASSGSLAPPPASPGRPGPVHSSASDGAAGGLGSLLSAPPARPASRLSNASSIDDLLGAAGPRKGGKKPRKSGRYVDVMAK